MTFKKHFTFFDTSLSPDSSVIHARVYLGINSAIFCKESVQWTQQARESKRINSKFKFGFKNFATCKLEKFSLPLMVNQQSASACRYNRDQFDFQMKKEFQTNLLKFKNFI